MFPEPRRVRHLVVSVWAKSLAEQLVSEYSRLWEAVNRFAYFEVDKTIFSMFVKVVLIDGCLQKNGDGHFHVLKTVHWCAEIEVLDVETHISGIFSADDAVPQHLCGREICRACREFSRIIDQVSARSEADSIWILFLRLVVDNNASVSDGAVVGYSPYLFVGHDKD